MGFIMDRATIRRAGTALAVAGATLWSVSASAETFSFFNSQQPPAAYGDPPTSSPWTRPRRRRNCGVRSSAYTTSQAPGTIVIDTPNTYLYYVLGGGRAIRYGIGVGREGFTWNGVQTVARKAEWPDWHPPAEMIARQPYLPRFMAGGPGNPLGARAMYLGGTVYRIHGTNDPSTIGKRVSSGCIRLTNEDVTDLYSRVTVGTKVVVLPMTQRGPDVARRRSPADDTVSSYAPPAPLSAPRQTWNGVRTSGLY